MSGSEIPQPQMQLTQRARELFLAADTDGNGHLSHRELKRLLQSDDQLRAQLRHIGGRHWKVCGGAVEHLG
jgi:hypothetical protein